MKGKTETVTMLAFRAPETESIWWRLRTVLSIPKELIKFVIKGKAEYGTYEHPTGYL